MSEFVLKLAGWDSSAPVAWVPGVTKVRRYGIAAWRDVVSHESTDTRTAGKWDSYEPDLQYMSNVIGPDATVTLLWVESADYAGYIVVEQAWLLGPGGGTVDRIGGVMQDMLRS